MTVAMRVDAHATHCASAAYSRTGTSVFTRAGRHTARGDQSPTSATPASASAQGWPLTGPERGTILFVCGRVEGSTGTTPPAHPLPVRPHPLLGAAPAVGAAAGSLGPWSPPSRMTPPPPRESPAAWAATALARPAPRVAGPRARRTAPTRSMRGSLTPTPTSTWDATWAEGAASPTPPPLRAPGSG